MSRDEVVGAHCNDRSIGHSVNLRAAVFTSRRISSGSLSSNWTHQPIQAAPVDRLGGFGDQFAQEHAAPRIQRVHDQIAQAAGFGL